MLAGLAASKGHEKESQLKFKRFMIMMDSMTNEGKRLLIHYGVITLILVSSVDWSFLSFTSHC